MTKPQAKRRPLAGRVTGPTTVTLNRAGERAAFAAALNAGPSLLSSKGRLLLVPSALQEREAAQVREAERRLGFVPTRDNAPVPAPLVKDEPVPPRQDFDIVVDEAQKHPFTQTQLDRLWRVAEIMTRVNTLTDENVPNDFVEDEPSYLTPGDHLVRLTTTRMEGDQLVVEWTEVPQGNVGRTNVKNTVSLFQQKAPRPISHVELSWKRNPSWAPCVVCKTLTKALSLVSEEARCMVHGPGAPKTVHQVVQDDLVKRVQEAADKALMPITAAEIINLANKE
jgi:hypothetical protein